MTGDLDRVVDGQAALQEIGRIELDDDREFAAAGLFDAAEDLEEDPGPVLDRPAPLVRPAVGVRGKEARDEIAVGGVELDAVEPRPLGPAGRGDEIRDEGLDLFARELARHDLGDGIVNGGRGDRDAAAELLLGLAPGMGDLEKDAGGIAVDGLGDAGQALDETIVIDRGLPGAGLSRRLDEGVAGDDETDFAFGQAAKKLDLVSGGHSPRRRPCTRAWPSGRNGWGRRGGRS